jgi:imidazolonepropionase-like amidohydrolase
MKRPLRCAARRLPALVAAVSLVVGPAVHTGCAVERLGAATEGQPDQDGTIVLRTARVLDGRGGVLTNRDVVIRDGRIAAIVAGGSARGLSVYDLTGVSVLPGYIDTHVHISRHFDPAGKLHPPEDRNDVGHMTLYGAENAYRTLMSGVTTVQSLGDAEDADLKTWIARGTIPGPRVLSSLGAVRAGTGSADQIRAFVRGRAKAGADVVKIFASTSIRSGGITDMSAAQLEAACGEARALGLRSVVHAHRGDGARLAAAAGCTQLEHGWMLDAADLQVIAKHGMYFGNQIDLLFRNYAEHAARFDGIGDYTLEGFANLQNARPGALKAFQEALKIPGMKIVYSTDAVAGGHGRNAQELAAYAKLGGQPAMDVIVAATSRAAESLRMADRIGAIAPGLEADIIALDGNPLADAAALDRVVFVMRAGRVFKHEAAAR